MNLDEMTLGEALPIEINRCLDLLLDYMRIGPNGAIGATHLRSQIKHALTVLGRQDPIEMLRSYHALKSCQ